MCPRDLQPGGGQADQLSAEFDADAGQTSPLPGRAEEASADSELRSCWPVRPSPPQPPLVLLQGGGGPQSGLRGSLRRSVDRNAGSIGACAVDQARSPLIEALATDRVRSQFRYRTTRATIASTLSPGWVSTRGEIPTVPKINTSAGSPSRTVSPSAAPGYPGARSPDDQRFLS